MGMQRWVPPNSLLPGGGWSGYGPYSPKFLRTPGNSPAKNPAASSWASGTWLQLLAGKEESVFKTSLKIKQG